MPLRGLVRGGAGELRFPGPYVFNGLRPPKTAVRPCTAEAVALCESLRWGEGLAGAPVMSLLRRGSGFWDGVLGAGD